MYVRAHIGGTVCFKSLTPHGDGNCIKWNLNIVSVDILVLNLLPLTGMETFTCTRSNNSLFAVLNLLPLTGMETLIRKF